MASMVVILRGQSAQTTIVDATNWNSLQSPFYVRLNRTIWQDPLNNVSQWNVNYWEKNTTSYSVSANNALHLNAIFAYAQYPQAVDIYRPVDFTLATDPVLSISLEASIGVHYGIRISGQDGSENPFQAWSETPYLQHRPGLGHVENFTIDSSVEAYKANGVFASPGSKITSLLFYIEATPGQTGQYSLNVFKIIAATPNQYHFNSSNLVHDWIDTIVLQLNVTKDRNYADNRFAQGYIDYYVQGTSNLIYTIYYMHGLTVIGQGFDYSAISLTYNVATFSSSLVNGYPPFLNGNSTYSIVLAPISGSFLSFQLGGYSVRYLSQPPATTMPLDINASVILAYYLVFLFVTPVVIVILVSKLFSHETEQAS